MNFLHNARTLLTRPRIARDYVNYQYSRLVNAGQAVRIFSDNIQIKGWSGFSEFHSAQGYIGPAEYKFLQTFPFGMGELIDVGANLGFISLILARRFPSKEVHAFEPNPSTFKALQENIALNKCLNVKAQPLVVSDYDGTIPFNANPINRGTTSILSEGSFSVFSTDLPCISLDTYAQQQGITNILFLKVDVEGYEEKIFRGAKDLLKRQNIQMIYYEVCPDNAKKANLIPEQPTQLLRENGYTIYQIGLDARLLPIKDFNFNQIKLENWIALNTSLKSKLEHLIQI